MNQKERLQDLGLNDLESSVYLALLKLGGSQASIIAKEVGVKRTSMYDVLSSLRKKGFAIVYFQNNKRIYHPQKPQRVVDLLEKKLSAFRDIIPNLQSLEKTQARAFGLQLIQTKEELEQFYVGVLHQYKNQTYDSIGSTPSWMGIDPVFFQKYWRDRAKAKIKTRCLITQESRDVNPTEAELLRDFRYLPKGYEFNSIIDIYPDKVLIINPQSTSIAVVLATPVMRDVFASMFELLWMFVGDNEIKK